MDGLNTPPPASLSDFDVMLATGRVYGTLLRHNGSGQLYWTPHRYLGGDLDLLSGHWICLGSKSSSEETKARLEKLELLAGHLPQDFGEYVFFGFKGEE